MNMRKWKNVYELYKSDLLLGYLMSGVGILTGFVLTFLLCKIKGGALFPFGAMIGLFGYCFSGLIRGAGLSAVARFHISVTMGKTRHAFLRNFFRDRIMEGVLGLLLFFILSKVELMVYTMMMRENAVWTIPSDSKVTLFLLILSGVFFNMTDELMFTAVRLKFSPGLASLLVVGVYLFIAVFCQKGVPFILSLMPDINITMQDLNLLLLMLAMGLFLIGVLFTVVSASMLKRQSAYL
jgi:hypothetical protein